MATIVSSARFPRRPAPDFSRLAQWLDELGPVLLLAAVLAIVAAAGYEARPQVASEGLVVARAMAE